MITRRQGREWALQLLVQFDLNPPASVDAGIEAFWEQQAQLELDALAEEPGSVKVVFTDPNPQTQASLAEVRVFAEERVRGVWAEREMLDQKIGGYLRNWSMYRLGSVERNALRIGAWEVIHCTDIPAPILVNEAIDLAKFFSETKSGKFVNGVMDKFAKDVRRPKAETFTPNEG
ncbi:MAG: transcription antitermination factor NusB [bacterium]|nr:transcription antitermination factor NusB [bacterium]